MLSAPVYQLGIGTAVAYDVGIVNGPGQQPWLKGPPVLRSALA